MCGSTNCECEDKAPLIDDRDILNYQYVIAPSMYELSYTQFTYAVDRQLEEMKRALYHTAIGHYRAHERDKRNSNGK